MTMIIWIYYLPCIIYERSAVWGGAKRRTHDRIVGQSIHTNLRVSFLRDRFALVGHSIYKTLF